MTPEPGSPSYAPPADLDVLRRAPPAPVERPRRPWLARLTVAVLVVAGLGVVYGLLQPLLFPRRVVRLAPVEAVEGGGGLRASGQEFAGYVEAEPFPTTARPLVKGVVERLEVVEGQEVKGGETVMAVLRSPDIENALRLAEATLALKTSDLGLEEARLAQRRSLLEQRLDPRAEVARLEGERDAAAAAVAAATAAVEEADAAAEAAQIELRGVEALRAGGGSTPIALETARQRVRQTAAAAKARRAEVARAEAESRRLENLLRIAREGVEDPRELSTEVTTQEAQVARARSDRDLAQVALDVARRNADLLTVRAPQDGIVLRLLSAPGSVAGPMEQMRGVPEEAAATTSSGVLDAMVGGIAALYDPQRIQARVDIQFPDLGGIGKGTEAEITAPSLPGRRFRGEVLRLVREAIILKGSLQAKVRILDPDPALTPEMLCRVRFLLKEEEAQGAPVVQRFRVPSEAVRGDAVFVLDPTKGGRARRVPVKVVQVVGGATEVEGALGLSQKVILDPVEDGERVRGPA
jgi:multidrug efflux pump subunit AcrA (membrane-fusion protein)